ncbi:PASTA domain-containing protein [Streptomyces sp. NPDC091290]|uniref:PASTA domain-containing protein n=1 Tax=Streptomyces sp. NPDC091290 TaxID=3365990 RepID=UPI00380D9E88
MGAVTALTILLAATACGEQGSGSASAERETPVRSVNGRLDTAIKATADQGKGFSLKDATSLGRFVNLAHAKDFKVCFEKERPELSAVDIFAVPRSERCPLQLGEERLPGKTPEVLGLSVREAVGRLTDAGYHPKSISVEVKDKDGRKVDGRHWSWKVCKQNPVAGATFSADSKPRVLVQASCLGD